MKDEESKIVNSTFERIKKADYQSLLERKWTESELSILSALISNDPNSYGIIKALIRLIPSWNINYDWNIGSLIPHWSATVIADVMNELPHEDLINSIGLTWGLGQLKSRARSITDFLRKTVREASNSDAWWRAAYSLQALGLESAVVYLKANLRNREKYTYQFCIDHFSDRRATIGLLLIIETSGLDKLIEDFKQIFAHGSREEKLNATWLVGRLRLEDPLLMKFMREQLNSTDYEISYYTLLSLRELSSESFRKYFETTLLNHEDVLYRNSAAYTLANIANSESINVLKACLLTEKNERVLGAITFAIDTILTSTERELVTLKKTSDWHENGMIKDKADKWYANPELYHLFSESQDPNKICLQIILNELKKHQVIDPIDLGTGTGKWTWNILEYIDFQGKVHSVDRSKEMINYIDKRIKRQIKASRLVRTYELAISEISQDNICSKSSLVISSFGFPSNVFDREIALKELQAVSEILTDDGLLITIGWDETFRDDLSEMWYKYIPDSLYADNFEDWRRKRAGLIKTPRNCDLTWRVKRIMVPIRFSDTNQAALVMGHLFGRSAAEWIIKKNKSTWLMSMGITVDRNVDIKKRLCSK